ncbi:AAA family ATPase [Roseibium sp.]|uniref:AAA family ATPase n=1 Tax=Roseibium sp. TaxID=1936156 RepID=UPI00391A071E
MKRSILSSKALNNVGTLIARMAVRKALRRTPEFWHRSAYIIGAKLPNDTDTDIYEEALAKEFGWQIPARWKREELPNFHYFTDDDGSSKYRRNRPFRAYSLARDVADHQRLVGVGTPKHPMSSPFVDIAETILEVRPEPEHIAAALHLARGIPVTEQQANELLSDTLTNLNTAFRGDRPLTSAFRMLRTLRKAEAAEPEAISNNAVPPSLKDMVGFGEAKSWGLELARDIQDWRHGKIAWVDVDRGILLVGKPGTGKTVYARTLAETCGAHFVECSLSKMQSRGHLGDMLKGIGRAFGEARKNSPAILFIDEFDDVGNRSTLSSHAPEYATKVITGLLQLMDGTENRDGVVIVAACNRLDTIDPAFLRPGRLERVIEIPLPDQQARKTIFRQHLNSDLPETVLGEVGHLTDGWSGADLEKLARECRRVARRAGGAPEAKYVLDVLSEKFTNVPPYQLERYAIHETGHVVAAYAIQGIVASEVVVRKSIRTDLGDNLESGGHTTFPVDRQGYQVPSDYHDKIAILLAGHAAENLVFDEASDSAGLASGSDLECATRIAARFIASSGLSGNLVFRADLTRDHLEKMVRHDKQFADACDLILKAQMRRVQAVLRENFQTVQVVASELVKSRRLNHCELEALFKTCATQ